MPKLTAEDLALLAWDKGDGLIPAVIQDAQTHQVLMLGYMNEASLTATFASNYVTFFSRSRQELWRKGETSGHTLKMVEAAYDCDQDTLLIQATAVGPTCHLGTTSCFGEAQASSAVFLDTLWQTITARAASDEGRSYTRDLLAAGVVRQAQKVGEEGVEVALAAACGDDQALLGEAADLTYHLLVLLKGRGLSLGQLVDELVKRHR